MKHTHKITERVAVAYTAVHKNQIVSHASLSTVFTVCVLGATECVLIDCYVLVKQHLQCVSVYLQLEAMLTSAACAHFCFHCHIVSLHAAAAAAAN
jgi:hypothetical protein